METTQTNEALIPQDDETLQPDRNSRLKKKIHTALIHPHSLKAVNFLSKVKAGGKKTLKELILEGLVVQVYYVLHDIRHGYGLGCRAQDTRARENIRLLFLHNLPKHLVIAGLVGWVPIPGTIEAMRAVLYNNPKLWKHRNMKFQTRDDVPADIAIGKLKRYGHQIGIIINTYA